MLLCLHAGVVMRRDGHELLLDAVADVERLDEVVDGLLCHGLVGARKRFQSLVRMWVAFAAEDGLYGLGYHGPCVVKVLFYLLFVQDELAQSLQRACYGDDAVPQGHTDVAEHGRVGQVALQTADGQFGGEKCEHGVGHAEVALAVFVVNGVDLMRHGAGAYLAGFDLLLEVIHGDVHPEVAVEVDDDGVDAANAIEDSGQIVIVADLCGPLLTLESEFLFDEAVAECFPVVGGVGHVVGIEVAGGSTELCGDFACLQGVEAAR